MDLQTTSLVKQIEVRTIQPALANSFIKRNHYSGKTVPNSQVHFGAFLNGRLHGVLQFGPSINKKGTINLVPGTAWNEFIELNRMAFDEALPRNSESRVIAICLRLLKKAAPHLKWVISFADATQCGTGTIYRASGFKLVGWAKNTALKQRPDGSLIHIIQAHHLKVPRSEWNSYKVVPGYQIKYLYKFDGNYSGVKCHSFAELDKLVYPNGVRHHARRQASNKPAAFHAAEGGVIPTPAHQNIPNVIRVF